MCDLGNNPSTLRADIMLQSFGLPENCALVPPLQLMVIASHDIKFETKFRLCMLCGKGDNADRFIFRWVYLNTKNGCFFKE